MIDIGSSALATGQTEKTETVSIYPTDGEPGPAKGWCAYCSIWLDKPCDDEECEWWPRTAPKKKTPVSGGNNE